MTMVQEREILAPSLDTEKKREVRVYGDHERKKVPVRNLIMMPQVRPKLNPEFKSIKESVRNGDLLNNPNIAVMTREPFAVYVEFVNEVWSSNLQVEDFDDMAMDGLYHLVVAGHTRTEGILEIAEEEDEESIVVCTVHDVDDPMKIVSIQLDENLHSKPPQERAALVIVESYLLGKKQKQWKNEEEFALAAGSKFSKEQVRDAVGFARLPSAIRDAVFLGRLPYNAALTLGRGSETIRDYTMAKLGYVMIANKTQQSRYDKAFNKNVTLLVAEVDNRALNSSASKKWIQARIDKFEKTTKAIYGIADISQPRIAMATPKDQDLIYLRELGREFTQKMNEVAARPLTATEDALKLYARLSGAETMEAQEIAARGRKRLVKSLGDTGLFADALAGAPIEREDMLGDSLFDELDFDTESVA